jgi:hypothetical protein
VRVPTGLLVQAIASRLRVAVVHPGALAPLASSTAREAVAPVGVRHTAAVPDPLFVQAVVLDGMWRVADDYTGGRRYRIAWFDPPFRPPLKVTTTALGICFTGDRRIVLVTWDDVHWSLPGRSLEAGETVEQALVRDVREEACARAVRHRYVGCQRVEELDDDRPAYYQARFWARVELEDFGPTMR